MATQSLSNASSLTGRVLESAARGLLALSDFADAVADSYARGRLAARLMEMSDTQLAARGLTRDQIVHHVYG